METNKNTGRKVLGGFWKKQSKNGKEYYSGILEIAGYRIRVVGFENQNKKSKNSPDLKIYLSEEKTGKKEGFNPFQQEQRKNNF